MSYRGRPPQLSGRCHGVATGPRLDAEADGEERQFGEPQPSRQAGKDKPGAPGVDGMTVSDLRPWIAANKSLPSQKPGTHGSPRCSTGAISRNRCAGWKSPNLAAASANWAFRRWSIAWCNRRSCHRASRPDAVPWRVSNNSNECYPWMYNAKILRFAATVFWEGQLDYILLRRGDEKGGEFQNHPARFLLCCLVPGRGNCRMYERGHWWIRVV